MRYVKFDLYKAKLEESTTTETTTFTEYSTARELRETLAKFYYILRDIALIISLIVLLYIGIRIITGSIAVEKAKYKQMLVDWIVSICLIFSMQYIMVFANHCIDWLIEVIDSIQFIGFNEEYNKILEESGTNSSNVEQRLPGVNCYIIDDKAIVEKAYDALVTEGDKQSTNSSVTFQGYFLDENYEMAEDKDSAKYLYWPTQNFLEQSRIELQLLDGTDEKGAHTSSIGWKLIYVVLVIYTLIFLWTYLKRIVYLAFLTIIAPLVALTYPIDKINDGKAQAYDMWLKEYIFNLLIQPMHLLLYMILIGSAMTFASKNVIYVAVALGFMVPAEKLVRKFFGFEKAQTPGLLAGPAGAALMMSGLNKLTHRGKRPDKGNSDSSNYSKEDKIKSYGATEEYSKYGEANTVFGGGGFENPEAKSKTETTDSEGATNTGATDPEGATNPKATDPEGATNPKATDPEGATNPKTIDPEGTANPKTIDPEGTANPKTTNPEGATNPKTTNPSDNTKKDNKDKEAKKRSILRAVKRYGRQRLINRGNKIRNYKFGRSAMRLATGAVGAGIGLTAGAIAGIAGGDPSKAFQYGAAGTAAGYGLTSSYGAQLYDSTFYKGALNDMEQAYYGADYPKELRQRADRQIKKDVQNIDYIQDHFNISRQEAKVMMQSDETQEALDAGLRDIEDIATVHSLIRDGRTAKEAVMLGAFAKDMKDNPKNMGKKTYSDYQAKYQRNFEEKGIDKDKAQKMSEELMKRVQNIYYAKKNEITADELK